jgi:hypothetical protein
MKPLSMEHNVFAIESAVLEISLSSVVIIPTKLITDGEAIVQTTKSARNSKLLRWGTIIDSVPFIGGFLVKAYAEERIQKGGVCIRHGAQVNFNLCSSEGCANQAIQVQGRVCIRHMLNTHSSFSAYL